MFRLSFRQFLAASLMLIGCWVQSAVAENAATAPMAPSAPAAGAIELPPGVAIVFDAANEASSLKMAVEDLQRDLKKVLGADSPVVANSAAAAGKPAIVVTAASAETAALRDASLASAPPEAHGNLVRQTPDGPRVVLQGSDVRGTIFAVYSFSDQFLDVPPLWYWASWVPARKESVSVPADSNIRFAPPHVRWRAWFPNDMDMLGPWELRKTSNPGGREPYDLMLETMLRLKLNAIDIDDVRDYPAPSDGLIHARMARDRGLAITSPHTSPFGVSLKLWPDFWRLVRKVNPPPLTVADPASIETYWQYHLDLCVREKLDEIWMVGFRGQGDHPFYDNVGGAPPDEAGRARIIRQMMEREIALIKKATGQEHPIMRTVLYNEQSRLFADGVLRPPEEPSLIWNFSSARHDHFPEVNALSYHPAAGSHRWIGYYFNYQFTSTGSHLADGEGPWKMEKNFRMVGSGEHGDSVFSVINVGNVREFVLGASANARMMWDWDHYTTDSFVKDYCARYFGAASAEAAAGIVRDYYNSYWQPKKASLPDFDRQYIFQDLRYARAGKVLLTLLGSAINEIDNGQTTEPLNPEVVANPLQDSSDAATFRIAPADSGAPDQLHAILAGTDASIQKLQPVVAAADALEKTIPRGSKRFFNDSIATQARFMLAANQWVNSLAHAMEVVTHREQCHDWLVKADTAATAMSAVLTATDRDAFTAWHSTDDKFGLKTLKEHTGQMAARFGPRKVPQ